MEIGNNSLEGSSATNLYTDAAKQASNLQSLDNSENAGSVFENNICFSDNEILSYDILEENDIELIKKELQRYIGELRDDLEKSKNTKGFLSSIGNGIAELFGKGDKGKETQIQDYEHLLSGLDENPQNILEVYEKIKGIELNGQDLNSLKTSNSYASSLDNQTQSAIVEELEKQLNKIEADFDTAKKSNGWISGAWNAIKNATGIGASSNKTQAEIDSMENELKALKNGETDLASAYKNITGKDISQSELESLASGETSLSETSDAGQSVEKYKEGQKMVVDTVADIVSGIVAVGAVALAPVTGGASLLVAGGVGAVLKVLIKASDCIGNEKTYTLKDGLYDTATGFVNGAMGPLTNGLGGAAGTSMTKIFGLRAVESTAKEGLEQALKYAGKEVVEEGLEQVGKTIIKEGAEELVEQGVKQAGKSTLAKILAMQGSEYVLKEGTEATLKTTIGKIACYGVDMMVDGSLSGAADGAIRAIAEGRYEDIASDTFNGFIGGGIFSPIIGGGMRSATKFGGTVLNKINNKITVGSLLPDGTATKFSQGEIGDCAFLSIFDGILNNEEMSRQLQKSILTDANGDIVVTIGTKAITVARESLTDEMLADKSGVRLFEQAYKQLIGSDNLDGGFADVVAKNLGLNPVHIEADAITDELLENISKQQDNAILSLGLKVNNEGIVDINGSTQHYFSIKNVDMEAKTIDLVDTYDTSKTITMSFDDIKTQGISIDGGTIKATDLPNVERSADDEEFYGLFEKLRQKSNQRSLKNNKHIQELQSQNLISDLDIENFAQLSKSQLKQLDSLLQNDNIAGLVKEGKIDANLLLEFAQLNKNQFKELETLLQNKNYPPVFDKNIEVLARLNLLLQEGKINGINLNDIAGYNEIQLKQLNLLLQNDDIVKLMQEGKINGLNLVNFVCLNETQIKQLNSLLQDSNIMDLLQNGKITGVNLVDFAKFNEAQLKQLNSLLQDSEISALIQNGKITGVNLVDFAKSGEAKFAQLSLLFSNKNIMTLIEKNEIDSTFLHTLIYTTTGKLKELNSLLQNNNITLLLQNGKITGVNLADITRFNETVLKRLNSLLQRKDIVQLNYKNILDTTTVLYYINSNMDLNTINFNEKVSLLSKIKKVQMLFEIGDLFTQDEISGINKFYNQLTESLKHTITPTQITKTNMKNMMSGFFANNNPSLDNLLASADFKQFGKQGLPLSYSRTSFLGDLVDSIKDTSNSEQAQILKKLGISLVKDKSGNIIGYNGIIDLTKLSTDGVEGKVLSLANKFIKENSINTGNSELDKALNSLIEGMPEFINVIGKQQHQTQELSVDAHILTVLQNAMANENYQSLSNKDKTCLKFATILHDIAKSEGVVDKMHPDASALFTRNIMEKYTFPKEMDDRIFELVKNHHWLEDYNTGNSNPDYIASLFRHKDDYSIAKIMAESDLKGVSDDFYNKFSNALDLEKQIPVVQALEGINSTGQLVFTSKIIRDDLIPRVEYKGETYKVIDFTKMGSDTDLTQFGFAPDVTYDNARFYIHMADNARKLETVDYLSDIANGGFLCASYVSTGNCNTYYNKSFGVSLEVENANIANAANVNQSSGGRKGFHEFGQIITGQMQDLGDYRATIPTSVKSALGLNDEEYSELFQLFASKKYISQIKDNETYKIGSKTINGKKIKEAIQEAGNNLFNLETHNESNLYNPKINAFVAKVDSIEEIPKEFLKFVREHDLPIYLFGN